MSLYLSEWFSAEETMKSFFIEKGFLRPYAMYGPDTYEGKRALGVAFIPLPPQALVAILPKIPSEKVFNEFLDRLSTAFSLYAEENEIEIGTLLDALLIVVDAEMRETTGLPVEQKREKFNNYLQQGADFLLDLFKNAETKLNIDWRQQVINHVLWGTWERPNTCSFIYNPQGKK